jgi:hypothetical protein
MCHWTFPTSFQKSRAGAGQGLGRGRVKYVLLGLRRQLRSQAKGKNVWALLTQKLLVQLRAKHQTVLESAHRGEGPMIFVKQIVGGGGVEGWVWVWCVGLEKGEGV